jgi:uncharacterized protein
MAGSAGRLAAGGGRRDRDSAGRARNARPRDSLGRPLARNAAGQPAISDDAALPPAQALAVAQQLLDDSLPFHAHEVLEAAWKAGPPAERDLWQGLAQLAVGLTHALRGNARGAAALLLRGARRLGKYAGGCPHDIAVDAVMGAANALAGRIQSGGLAGLGPADLTLRLTVEPRPPSASRG